MALAARIIVAAGTITLANEAFNAPYVPGKTDVTSSIKWKVIPATVVAAVLFTGLEKVNHAAGVGLAALALVTTLIAPMGAGPSPVEPLAEIMGSSSPL